MTEREIELLTLLNEFNRLGIAEQIDYNIYNLTNINKQNEHSSILFG